MTKQITIREKSNRGNYKHRKYEKKELAAPPYHRVSSSMKKYISRNIFLEVYQGSRIKDFVWARMSILEEL